MVCFINHALLVPSFGWPLSSLFSWAMKIATEKANKETARARNAGYNSSFQN